MSDAQRFLNCLAPEAPFFTFQTFIDRKDADGGHIIHGTFAERGPQLKRLNDAGHGVFVTINETDGRGRKLENIISIRAVFLDLDGSPLEPVLKNRMPPHIVTETSPGRFHCYWRVSDMPLADFKAVQIAIAERYDGDPVVCDLPRVMRLVGFHHHKAEPFLSRIISIHDAPAYPASAFERAEVEQHFPGAKEPATPLDLWLTDCALKTIPTALDWGTRNHVGMATWRATDGDEFGFEAWRSWLQRSGRYDARATRRQWQAYFRSRPNRIGLGTLVFLAKQVDPDWHEKVMADLMDEIGGIA